MTPVPVGLGATSPLRGVETRIRMSPQRDDHEGSSFLRASRAVRRSRDDLEGSSFLRGGKAVRRSRRAVRKQRLKSLVAALLLTAGPSAAVTWLMISPRFAVRELAVVTGERVPEVWVREALAPVVGENLPRLPLAQAEQILRHHPWVRGADLRKDLPARLTVRVAERQAVALLRATDGLHYLDSAGARIAAFDPSAGRAVDLPLISVTGTMSSGETAGLRSAVQLLSEIDDVEPPWAAGLSEIEVLGEEDFRIHTPQLPFPVLVRTGTLNQRVRRLEELLPHIVERFGAVAAVDLRFARRIIVKPSADNGNGRSRPGPSRPGPARPAPTAEYREATTDHAQRG